MEHRIVARDEWLKERIAFLAREKEVTRLRDELAAERRALPWTRVEKPYVFEGPSGRRTLAELFDGRSQLFIYHFMFGPDWPEGCPSCSFLADHFDGANMHLKHHDVTLAAVSRAPFAKIAAFKERMGWHFPWFSSADSSFNFDFQVSFTEAEKARNESVYNYSRGGYIHDELHGLSVFCKTADGVFHTYSAYARGAEPLAGAYSILDLTPKGRGESGPNFDLRDWVRHHDRYEMSAAAAACCHAEIAAS